MVSKEFFKQIEAYAEDKQLDVEVVMDSFKNSILKDFVSLPCTINSSSTIFISGFTSSAISLTADAIAAYRQR